jgi:Mor family transcriptional regulator
MKISNLVISTDVDTYIGNQIYQDYLRGVSVEEQAVTYSLPLRVIKHILQHRYGIVYYMPIRKTNLNHEKILEDYNKGMSRKELMKKYQCTQGAIKYIINKGNN